ncbi:enoyl-CoA hydratase [Motiliproteus sp. SC1-56]|uniref:enoyl-CoA hydratase n=1 Tax=Motiliproteus sp. SC1-56 TaxID=2799565 RepID=UPI001A8D2F84|nr:enoyl-CoA hydratase [Motiliproteus sp. SC1-56]
MPDQAAPLVLQNIEATVATLTLNRPDAYNALSIELMEALLARLQGLAEDREVHVIILKGAGRGFCAGHDLRQMSGNDDPEFHRRTFETCSRLMLQITRQPQPVIAQVQGIATAAGCQLVATCDLAVATDTARFATPGVNIGLFCSTPMVALSRAIARKQAMEMLLTGEMVDARRACEIGLINQTAPEEVVDEVTLGLAAKIAGKSPHAIRLGKEAFYQQLEEPLSQAYAHCSDVMCCNMDSDDAREGIDAFLNKREPVWKGQ